MPASITALIPVREGSTRLKNTNIAPFAGTNLLLFQIEQPKRVPEIARIVVTSDSAHMLAMAREAGVETHQRAPENCDEKTKTFGEVVRHVAESVAGEHLLWATCTAPSPSPGTIAGRSPSISTRCRRASTPSCPSRSSSATSGTPTAR